jgi:hypothetical protein
MLRRLRLALLMSVVVAAGNYWARRGGDTRFSEFTLVGGLVQITAHEAIPELKGWLAESQPPE